MKYQQGNKEGGIELLKVSDMEESRARRAMLGNWLQSTTGHRLDTGSDKVRAPLLFQQHKRSTLLAFVQLWVPSRVLIVFLLCSGGFFVCIINPGVLAQSAREPGARTRTIEEAETRRDLTCMSDASLHNLPPPHSPTTSPTHLFS